MRKIDRMIFECPAIKHDGVFAFDPQRAADHYFAKKLAEAKAAAAAKASAAAK